MDKKERLLNMKIAALYIRVSTDDQLEFSPEAQRKALIDYAKKNGYVIDERYVFVDEGISGTSAKRRPAFQHMIALAKKKPKPFDAILVHKFDRFARSREDSVVYKSLLRRDCGIKVISITEHMEDDKFSVILEAMLEAMAEYYSLNLSDEVMKGMTEKATRGQVQHPATFGYKTVDSKYVIIEDQAEIVRLIFDKFVNEGIHCSSICRLINAMGIKNIRGNEWDVRGIKRILRNPAYIGTLRWNYVGRDKNYKSWVKDESEWIIVENAHEPIIDKELFEKANKRLDGQSANKSNKRPASYEIKHYLSGLLRCSNCGGTLIYSKLNNGKNDFFQCGAYRRGKCNVSNSIVAYKIESVFKEGLIEYVNNLNEDYLEQARQNNSVTSNNSAKQLLEKQLEGIKKKYEIAKKAYLAEIDTLEEYAENKKIIKEEEESIKKALLDVNEPIEIVKTRLVNKAKTFIEMLDDETISAKEMNDYLKTFITAIYINKKEDVMKIDSII